MIPEKIRNDKGWLPCTQQHHNKQLVKNGWCSWLPKMIQPLPSRPGSPRHQVTPLLTLPITEDTCPEARWLQLLLPGQAAQFSQPLSPSNSAGFVCPQWSQTPIKESEAIIVQITLENQLQVEGFEFVRLREVWGTHFEDQPLGPSWPHSCWQVYTVPSRACLALCQGQSLSLVIL